MLEEKLATWHNAALDKLTPEQVASTVQTEQIESLTFHLLRQRQTVADLTGRLAAKEKELASAVENIESLEDELDAKNKELDKAKKAPPAERPAAVESREQAAGQRFGISGIPTDEELESLLAPAVMRDAEAAAAPKQRKSSKTFKDFIQLVRRMEQIKLYDAALVMDMNQDDILIWTRALERKGYLTLHGLREKTIIATDKLLKTR